MTEFDRGSFGERVVMQCQVCNNPHHGEPKEVFVPDPRTGAYAKKLCPLCMCLDCVQQFDDPIRSKVRPLMMGQTLQSECNLTMEQHVPGEGPTKKTFNLKGPGRLNLPELLKQMGDVMGIGLQPTAAAPRHNLAVACGCGKNATSKCIACEKPLCIKCLKAHGCDES